MGKFENKLPCMKSKFAIEVNLNKVENEDGLYQQAKESLFPYRYRVPVSCSLRVY